MPNKNKTSDSGRKLRIPPVGILDNIVISESDAWAYYVLSEKPFDFLSQGARIDLANATMTSLSGLCQTADKRIDCHLLISNQPFDPELWIDQMQTLHKSYIKSESGPFNRFIEEQALTLYNNNYKKRVTYLGVKLFSRKSFDLSSMNPLEFGFRDVAEAFKKSVNSVFLFQAGEISGTEEVRLRRAEEEVCRILSSSFLEAKRPTSEDLLLSIKRRLYPAMPTPHLEVNPDERVGLSDIIIESGGTVEVKPRWLYITQAIDGEIYEGYRATLSFSKFPNDSVFPGHLHPFLYRQSILPFTVNCRFTMVPTEAMKKELGKKKLDAEDEINNLVESGQRATKGLKNTMTDIAQLESDIEESRFPWLSGSYRITVEASNETILKDIISELKQEYAKSDYVLSWTTGDQLDLLREEFPGGKLEMSDFTQTTNLALIATAGINFGGLAGDPIQEVRRRRITDR